MSRYLVFDIETSSLDWDSFSESQQDYLLRGAESEEEIEKKKFEMALSPFTSEIVCIGLQFMEGDNNDWKQLNKAAFSTKEAYSNDDLESIELSTGDKCYVGTEKKILEDFWGILRKYPDSILISFNGRGFDAPYMMLRSAVNNIRPSRNLMAGTKFNYPQHIDLADELTFYTGGWSGATKRYNFDFYARSFGIISPKAEGVDGSMVSELYKNGEIAKIAEYCLRDVSATWELFLKWNNLLRY